MISSSYYQFSDNCACKVIQALGQVRYTRGGIINGHFYYGGNSNGRSISWDTGYNGWVEREPDGQLHLLNQFDSACPHRSVENFLA